MFTRAGIERVVRYAFELARDAPAAGSTSATKSNGIIHTMPFWDEVVDGGGRRASRTSRSSRC